MCIIVIKSTQRSIGPHSATCQLCCGLPAQQLLLYELCVAQGHFSRSQGDDGDGDGIGDGDHSPRSTETSRLAMSMLASKLPQS